MGRRWLIVCAVAAIGVTAVGGALAEDEKPSGTLTLETKAIAVGVGVTWGDGKLTFGGQEHMFTVRGLSVLDLGVSKVSARGEVYNLKRLSDFSGNYVAAEAGAAVAGGANVLAMQNQNGVVILLTGVQQGARLSVAGEGVAVKLE